MYGTSQRFPPAHFNGGLSLGILLAFEVGAGGETRTLMRSEPRQILRALPRTTIYIFRPFHLFSAFSFHNDSLKSRCVLQMRPSLEKRCVYMSRERKGSIVERDGKVYARIQFIGSDGKKRDRWRRAHSRTHAREVVTQLIKIFD